MTNLKFQKHIQEALVQLEEDGELRIRENYSGRRMYDRKCVGVVVSDPFEFFADLTENMLGVLDDVWESDVEKYSDEMDRRVRILNALPDFIRSTKMDSMGMDSILYWERFQWDEGLTSLSTDREEEDDDISSRLSLSAQLST